MASIEFIISYAGIIRIRLNGKTHRKPKDPSQPGLSELPQSLKLFI